MGGEIAYTFRERCVKPILPMRLPGLIVME
jgi:hypothetical protein